MTDMLLKIIIITMKLLQFLETGTTPRLLNLVNQTCKVINLVTPFSQHSLHCYSPHLVRRRTKDSKTPPQQVLQTYMARSYKILYWGLSVLLPEFTLENT